MAMSSVPCTKSELDIFAVSPLQTAIEDGEWIEYHPITHITANSPIQFHVSGNSDYYLDLAQSYVIVTVKLKKTDGTPISAEDKVGPVNLLLHSLFAEVEVSLNEKIISPSNNTYPYRSYIETILNYGSDVKQSRLTSELFYMDEAEKMNSPNNEGLIARQTVLLESEIVEMMGKLHCDIFMQPKLILNQVDCKVKLHRSKPEFYLIANEDKYMIEIEEAKLLIRKEKPSASVQLAHEKALLRGNAKYPIQRTVCKVLTVPRGNLMFSQDNVYQGQLPNRIIIGMVDDAAFNGNIMKNPYNFHHYNLNFLGVYIEGKSVPHKPLILDFKRGQYIQAYHSIFQALGKSVSNDGNFIDRKEYKNGYTLFAFDLTPDTCEGGYFTQPKKGNLRLELHFGKALPETIAVIILAEYQNIIEIDKSRNIIYDFGL